MIRVVFDANVLVAGTPATSGTLAALIDQWRAREFQVVISEHIIDGVSRGWAKPYWLNHISPSQVDRGLRLIRRKAEWTAITVNVEGPATHPEDDLVLATAVSGNAEFLVTSDIPFRGVGSYRGIVILTPREFLNLPERKGQLRGE